MMKPLTCLATLTTSACVVVSSLGASLAQAQEPPAGLAPATQVNSAVLGPDSLTAAEDYDLAATGPNAEPGLSTPTEDPTYPQYSNPEFDTLKTVADLKWDGQSLNATATITMRVAQPTSTLNLDLSDALKVSSVTVDGKAVQISHSGYLLTMQTGALEKDSRHTVVINYSGVPRSFAGPSTRPDLRSLGWNARNGTVSMQQEPVGAFTWLPSNDHFSDKMLYEVNITTKAPMVGVSNGLQTKQETANGSTTTSFVMDKPIATYQITVGIDTYKVDKFTMSDGVPFTIWYTDQDTSSLNRAREEFKRSHDFMLKYAGPYPYSTGGMVITSQGSALETATMMVMSRNMYRTGLQPVLMHELGHHWFGDAVTPLNFKDNWIKEGFTMYMENIFKNGLNNPAGNAEQQCANAKREAGPASNPRQGHYAEPHVYICPMIFLDQARRDMGNEAFISKVSTRFVPDFAYQNIDRAQFTEWFNRVTGKNYTALIAKALD